MRKVPDSLTGALLAIMILAVFSGCSGSNFPNPVQPPVNRPLITPSHDTSNSPVHPNRITWGLWNISASDNNARIIPVRTATAHFNVLRLLEYIPCSDCIDVKIVGLEPPDIVDVNITIRHPITGNLNYTGFDVRGIFITNPDYTFPGAKLSLSLGEENPYLLNPDGFTNLFNPVDFSPGSNAPSILKYTPGTYSNSNSIGTTLNPFRAYAKNTPRRMFLPGTEWTETFRLKIPDPDFSFGYAVDANWIPPGKIVTYPETDFPPAANCTEPYEVNVTGTGPIEPVPGVPHELTLTISDHQDPGALTNVMVEIADIVDEPPAIKEINIIIEDQAEIRLEYSLKSGTQPGIYPVLVTVTDNANDPDFGPVSAYMIHAITVDTETDYPPYAVINVESGEIGVCDGITFDGTGSYDPDGGKILKYEWDFGNDGNVDETGPVVDRSYDTPGQYEVMLRVIDDDLQYGILSDPFIVTVVNESPVAIAFPDNTFMIVGGTPVTFDGSYSFDPDCNGQSIVSWEWDWENDGEFNESGVKIEHSWPVPGIKSVQLRVTDNEGETSVLQEPLEINVLETGNPPVPVVSSDTTHQNISQLVYLSGSLSYDPDGGYITKWEWDLDGDLKYETEGENISNYWLDPGSYQVRLRVTDSQGEVGVLAQPHVVEIVDPVGFGYSFGGMSNYDVVTGLDYDLAGDLFILGYFEDSADLDPTGGYNVFHADDRAFFLSKFDPYENYLWTSIFDEGIYKAVMHVSDGGNIYLGGNYHLTVDFDPGPGVVERNPEVHGIRYLLCLAPGGEFNWVYTWGFEEGTYEVEGIDTNQDGNIFVCGTHINGEFHIPYLTSISPDGSFIWEKTWGLENLSINCADLAINNFGNVNLVGGYYGTADFDPGPGVTERTNPGSGKNMYLSRFDTDGNFFNVVTWDNQEDTNAEHVAVSVNGDICITGFFHASLDLDPGPGEYVFDVPAYNDFFVVGLDAGMNFTWGDEYGTGYNDSGLLCSFSPSGDIFVAGTLQAQMTVNLKGKSVDLIPVGGDDLFAIRYLSDGTFIDAFNQGGNKDEDLNALDTDMNGNFVIGGAFKNAFDFDPGPGSWVLYTIKKSRDAFIEKLTPEFLW